MRRGRRGTGQPLPDHLVLLVWSLLRPACPLGGLLERCSLGLAVTLGGWCFPGPSAPSQQGPPGHGLRVGRVTPAGQALGSSSAPARLCLLRH